MVHSAPGGPFDEDKAVSPEVMDKLNERYNLNAPLIEQYTDYLGGVAIGDFGPSFFRSVPAQTHPHFAVRSERTASQSRLATLLQKKEKNTDFD